jgi:hypothetical protein
MRRLAQLGYGENCRTRVLADVNRPPLTHYFSTDQDTIIQINSSGPWGLNYVNPKDDPRQKTQ